MTDFMATFNVDNVFPQVPLIIGEQKDFNNLPFRKVTSVLGFANSDMWNPSAMCYTV